MRRYLWISIAVAAVLAGAFITVGNRQADASPAVVHRYIEDIPKIHGIPRTDERMLEGQAVLGSGIEKSIRRFLHIPTREKPWKCHEYLFKTSDGGLVVSFHEVGQEVTQVVLVGKDFDSSPGKEISRALRELVPNASYSEIPSDINGDSRWRMVTK